jgi:hypothetical protein
MRNPFRNNNQVAAPAVVTPDPYGLLKWSPAEKYYEYRAVVAGYDGPDDKSAQFPIVSVLATDADSAKAAITAAVNTKALEMGVNLDYLSVSMLQSPLVVATWSQAINTAGWNVFATPAGHPAIAGAA